MRLQHVNYRALMSSDIDPGPWMFRLYKGQGFWDLTISTHRWRWFW